jgi:MFS family permease
MNSPISFPNEPRSQQHDDHDSHADCPEGGLRAWTVVLGAWCAMVPSMGMLNTIGILDAWIGENQLEALPKSQTAWIVSLYAFFLYIGGSCAGKQWKALCTFGEKNETDLDLCRFPGAIFDRYGLRPVIIPGSIGMVASLMCLSCSTEYYQFLLSFGVLGGLSACCLFTPSVSTIGHWFNKRQGLATGLACTAGGIGGILFSFITLYLAPKIGFPWTMRIIAFISLVLCSVACLTLQTRPPAVLNPAQDDKKKPNLLACLRRAIDLKPLAHDPAYLATTIAVFLIEFAVFLPITYISTAALATGPKGSITHQNAYRLIALLNVGSVPGRALPNYLSDTFGRFNVMIITALVCTILIFCIWLPPTVLDRASEPAFTAFAVLFGFWSGAAISLTPVCIAQVSRVEEIGRRVGTCFSISSFGALVGVPIGGAIIDASEGSFTGLVVFAGCFYVLALGGFVVARFVAGPKNVAAVF